jgi:hypothetical protein
MACGAVFGLSIRMIRISLIFKGHPVPSSLMPSTTITSKPPQGGLKPKDVMSFYIRTSFQQGLNGIFVSSFVREI